MSALILFVCLHRSCLYVCTDPVCMFDFVFFILLFLELKYIKLFVKVCFQFVHFFENSFVVASESEL